MRGLMSKGGVKDGSLSAYLPRVEINGGLLASNGNGRISARRGPRHVGQQGLSLTQGLSSDLNRPTGVLRKPGL